MTFHMLRHTFATRWLESGEPIEVLSEFLGHEDKQTTANVYADVLKEYMFESSNKFYEHMEKVGLLQ